MTTGFLWEGTFDGARYWKGISPEPPPSEPIVMLERHIIPGYTSAPSKEQILEAVADARHSFMGLSTHGSKERLNTFDPDPKHPFGVKWAKIYDTEFRKAMRHRPPFRLVLMLACYSADGQWDEIFTHDYRKMTAVIACTDLASGTTTRNRITKFVELVSDPVNSDRTLAELLEEAKGDSYNNPDSPFYRDDPHFFGDARMKSGDIFRPSEASDYDEDGDGEIKIGEALRAIEDYFHKGLNLGVALETIQLYFKGAK